MPASLRGLARIDKGGREKPAGVGAEKLFFRSRPGVNGGLADPVIIVKTRIKRPELDMLSFHLFFSIPAPRGACFYLIDRGFLY